MNTISKKRMNFNKNIKLNFAGGNLTSNSGLLLYKEFDNKIKFSQIIKESLSFDDNIDHKKHENEMLSCKESIKMTLVTMLIVMQ